MGGAFFLGRRHFSMDGDPTPRMQLHPATTEPMDLCFYCTALSITMEV